MGFFDDYWKKVLNSGQKAMQKTQEISDAQSENKVNNVYYQIGKFFVDICRNNCKLEFAGIVTTIVKLEQQNIIQKTD